METTVSEFKEKLSGELVRAAEKLGDKGSRARLQISLNLDIAPATYDRYTGGKLEDLRNFDLAEKILVELKKYK